MRNIEYQQLPNGELSYKLFSESGQLQQSGTTTQEAADSGLFGADTSDNYNVSYAEPIERVGTGISTEVSAGSVRPGSTSIGEQPVQAAAVQAVEPQDDVVRRSDEGPSGGYPQFVQDPVPRAADIGRADPQTFESPIATEYDSFDQDSFIADALARFRGGQEEQEEQVRTPEQIAESEARAKRIADRDPGSLWYSDDPGSPMRNQDFNYAGLTRPEDNPRNTTNPDQSMLIDTFGKNIGAQGVSSLGDMSSNDMQRMLNRGTISQGSISDVEQRIGDIQANTPPASAPVQLDDMGVEVNSIIDVLGTGNVLDPGTSGLASAGQAASSYDFGVQDTFNPSMMSEYQSSSMQLPSFGQAMQSRATLPQGGLGSLSQPIAPLQQFNISGSYNAPPIKSPFV